MNKIQADKDNWRLVRRIAEIDMEFTQTERQIARQTDRQTDRQTNRETDQHAIFRLNAWHLLILSSYRLCWLSFRRPRLRRQLPDWITVIQIYTSWRSRDGDTRTHRVHYRQFIVAPVSPPRPSHHRRTVDFSHYSKCRIVVRCLSVSRTLVDTGCTMKLNIIVLLTMCWGKRILYTCV